MHAPHSHRGFTLIEVLTVVVVIAVITAVAIPLWRSQMVRARRADATLALVTIQNAQDRYFGRHARYAEGSRLTTAPPEGLGVAATSRKGLYRLEVRTSADGLGYTAVARALAGAGQADERCAELALDQVGRRTAVDSAGVDRSADCWR